MSKQKNTDIKSSFWQSMVWSSLKSVFCKTLSKMGRILKIDRGKSDQVNFKI